MSLSNKKILFQLTGSIAAYKACEVISQLVKEGCEVQTVASANALKFVGEATLEGLTGKAPCTDTYQSGQMMSHIHLIRWADAVVLCPATARMINSLAHGTGDDLISTLYLAHDFQKPYLLAPAMNHFMFHHPSTQLSLKKLKGHGLLIIEPESGALACGETGDGRLAEPERIFKEICTALALPAYTPTKGQKVLITFGGTEEPIDGVRSISNFSTGQTGAFLADELEMQGFAVTTLQAERSARSKLSHENHFFKSFADLEKSLKELLQSGEYDTVIHLAAVSDYSVDSVQLGETLLPQKDVMKGKISSDENISIQLKRNKKLIHELKDYSPKPLKVIGFKLTNTVDSGERNLAIQKLFRGPNVDFVVHNDLSEISQVEGKHQHRIFQQDQEVSQGRSKQDMAQALGQIIEHQRPSL